MVILIGLAVLALIIWAFSRGKANEAKVAAQYELRYPTLDEYSPTGDTFHGRTFADFARMLLVDVTSDYNFEHCRVFHLRRRDGPIWEAREEDSSRARSWKHLEARKRGDPVRDFGKEEASLKDEESWTALDLSTLETAYQLFLKHHDATVVFPRSPVDNAVASDFVRGSPPPGMKSGTPAGATGEPGDVARDSDRRGPGDVVRE